MIPSTVRFTGLDVDPLRLIQDRCVRGVIPATWHRVRFAIAENVDYPISALNRWLTDRAEGRWAAYVHFIEKQREIVLSFEHDFDAVTFVLSGGKVEALKEPTG